MTTFTSSSLLVGLLAVAVAVVMASVIPVEKRTAAREARAADCHVDGRSIPDGNNFTRFMMGPCIVFKCNAGKIIPLKNGCYRNGQCHPLGDKYLMGCLERTCTTTNGRTDYKLTREGCRAHDGLTCINVGSTWTITCVKYYCSRIVHSEFSISYNMDLVAWGCQLGNECVPENYTIREGYHVKQCQRRSTAIGFYTLKLESSSTTDCHVDGRSIPNGNHFTQFKKWPCIVFKCNAGTILRLKNGCHRNGQCYPIGDKYSMDCFERTCTTTKGQADYELTREGCRTSDGLTCINVGSTWTRSCITYRCNRIVHSEFSISYNMDLVELGCQLGNECVPENYTITEGCNVKQCQRRSSAIGFYILKLGCSHSGECLEIGQSKTTNCTTMTCQSEHNEGTHYLSIRPTKIQCQDADEMCHDSGSYFPLVASGRRLNCTCFVHEGLLGTSYTCPSQ